MLSTCSAACRGGWTRRRPIRRREPLAGDAEADVAVVGGGYTGLWTALELKRRDPSLRVTVLEAAHVGWGPSGRNGGFLETYWCALAAAALAARRRRRARARPRLRGRARGGRGARRGRLAPPRRDARGLDDARAGRGRRGRDPRGGRARRPGAGGRRSSPASRRSSAAPFASPTRRPSSRRGWCGRSAARRSTPESSCTSARACTSVRPGEVATAGAASRAARSSSPRTRG